MINFAIFCTQICKGGGDGVSLTKKRRITIERYFHRNLHPWTILSPVFVTNNRLFPRQPLGTWYSSWNELQSLRQPFPPTCRTGCASCGVRRNNIWKLCRTTPNLKFDERKEWRKVEEGAVFNPLSVGQWKINKERRKREVEKVWNVKLSRKAMRRKFERIWTLGENCPGEIFHVPTRRGRLEQKFK